LAKPTGIIDESVQINIGAAPIILDLQQTVMRGLAHFLEAKASVLREIARLSSRQSLQIEHQG